jgi:hypothetical protein
MMTGFDNVLPKGFSDLNRFVEKWAKETTHERIAVRSTSTQEEILEFYNAALALGERAMEELGKYPLDDMPEDVANLAKLMLALAQASVAVELHGQPRAIGTTYPNSIKVARGAFPFG